MYKYVQAIENVDLTSKVHVKDLEKLMVNGHRCVALFNYGVFERYYEVDEFYSLPKYLHYNDFCLGIYDDCCGSLCYIVNVNGFGTRSLKFEEV